MAKAQTWIWMAITSAEIARAKTEPVKEQQAPKKRRTSRLIGVAVA